MTTVDNTKKGIMLALVGIFILSPDSLLVRLIDAPFYTLMFWRGLFMFLSLTLFLLMSHKKATVKRFIGANRSTLLMSFLFATSTFLFVGSLQNTSVAHTLLIVGLSPIFSALFSVILLKEVPRLRVWIAIATIIAALAMVVQQTEALVTLKGDLYALFSAVIMGYTFVHVRKYTQTDLTVCLSLSGLWTALISIFLAGGLQISIQDGVLLLILGALVGAAFSLITLSARYVQAPISSMFMPLETVFGVLLVWLVIGEEPSATTLLGGAIIIGALVIIAFFELTSTSKS